MAKEPRHRHRNKTPSLTKHRHRSKTPSWTDHRHRSKTPPMTNHRHRSSPKDTRTLDPLRVPAMHKSKKEMIYVPQVLQCANI